LKHAGLTVKALLSLKLKQSKFKIWLKLTQEENLAREFK